MKVVRWTHHANIDHSNELVKAIKSYPQYGLGSGSDAVYLHCTDAQSRTWHDAAQRRHGIGQREKHGGKV